MMGNCLLQLFIIYTCSGLIYAYPTDASVINNEQKLNAPAKKCIGIFDFSNLQLNVVKEEFFCNSSVKQLLMSHNNIEKIDKGVFKNLPFLEVLDLSDNHLNTSNLFSFGEIPSLKRLKLDRNFYNSTIEEETFNTRCANEDPNTYWSPHHEACINKYSKLNVPYNYPELNSLSLRNTRLNSTDADWEKHFPKLTNLDLSENNFTENTNLIDSIPSMVTNLKLKGCNISSLNIEKLSNINKLYLNANNFKTLSIDNCDNDNTLCLRNTRSTLKFLHISNCTIKKINANAFSHLDLVILDMSHNEFEDIPVDAFNSSSYLQDLDISGNFLSTFNFINSLRDIYKLSMNNMKNKNVISLFEDIPAKKSLQVLELKRNEITNVPASFLMKFPNIVALDLRFNMITSLPPWEPQSTLKYLYLTSNKIRNVQDISLRGAIFLEYLELKDNPISDTNTSGIKYLPKYLTIKYE